MVRRDPARCKCQGGTLECVSGVCPRRPEMVFHPTGLNTSTPRQPQPKAEGRARPLKVKLNEKYTRPGTEIEKRKRGR